MVLELRSQCWALFSVVADRDTNTTSIQKHYCKIRLFSTASTIVSWTASLNFMANHSIYNRKERTSSYKLDSLRLSGAGKSVIHLPLSGKQPACKEQTAVVPIPQSFTFT